MSSPDEQNFEDPALKGALRRQLCGECAPARLRERIAQCLATTKDADGGNGMRLVTGPTAPIRLNPTSAGPVALPTVLPGLAIAAALLIAIGGVALLLSESSQTIPGNLQAAAIARHDGCCEVANHANVLPDASLPEIGAYLRNVLHHPVLAADMNKDDPTNPWKFRGVSICPVGGIDSAHLLFSRHKIDSSSREETLSVFSLPASAFPALSPHQTYEGTTPDGHSVVARSEDGAVYCLVSRAPPGEITVDTLDHILDQHKSEAIIAEVPQVFNATLAAIPREP